MHAVPTPSSPVSPAPIETQVAALSLAFRQVGLQNRKLASLYQQTRQRRQEVTLANARFSRDLRFLRDYCLWLEEELSSCGRPKRTRDMLSRKETADSIFLTYAQSTEGLAQQLAETQPLSPLGSPHFSLGGEGQQLGRLQSPTAVHSAVQVSLPEDWRAACLAAQQRAWELQRQVRELRDMIYGLQLEKARRGVARSILQARGELFDDIHNLISEYRKKISELAHEKKDIERKYKGLKEKISHTDHNRENHLVELYSQKMDNLQKLTEKQQREIENTIELYDVQLKKIEERRKEEINHYENQRIDIQTENLQMCIELQKALNNHDNLTRLHQLEKNKSEQLQKDLDAKKRELEVQRNSRSQVASQRMHIIARLHLCAAVFEYNRQAEHPYDELQDFQSAKLSASSFNCPLKNDQNSNTENYEYQYSEMLEKQPIIHKLSEAILPRRESSSKKSVQRITITYGQPEVRPNYVQTHKKEKLIAQSSSNRSYDHIIQYKKRFMGQVPRNDHYQ